MATDLTIELQDQPGTLAQLARALGDAGINIDGTCAVTTGGRGIVHVLVDDAAAARSAIEGAGLSVAAEHDVLLLSIDSDVANRPGELARVAGSAAAAGHNLTFLYPTADGRLALGADDVEALRDALG